MSNLIVYDLAEIELLPVTGLSIIHPALSGSGEWITSALYPGEGSLFEARPQTERDSAGRPRVLYYEVRAKVIVLQTEAMQDVVERLDSLKNKPANVYLHLGFSKPFGVAADADADAAWEAYKLNTTGGRSLNIPNAMVYVEVETATFGVQTVVNVDGVVENLYESV